MGISQVDRFDYYGKLEKYLKIYPGKSELDFTTNEIDFYNDFIKKLESAENIDLFGGLEYLHNCKKYREFFIDKKRIFENSQNNQQNITTNENEVIKLKKINRNLLLNGSDLNLSERFKIANEVLNIDATLRKLNIKDLEKYKLLSYILNCSEDNARHLMNGKYNSKDRDLRAYFNELNLNK